MLSMKYLPGTTRILPGWMMAILILISLISPVSSAIAEETGQIRLAVQPGLSGLYKLGIPTGLQVSISNQGDVLNGLLVVVPTDSQEVNSPPSQSARYQKSIQVPARSLRTTTIMLPSEIINQGAKLVLLVDGKPIAASPIQGTAVNGGFIALSLGEKPLKGGVAAWLDQTFGGQTAIKYLAPAHLPENPLELLTADIIILDDVAVAQLNKQQMELLKDWVALGGMLLLSEGAGSAPNDPLADISPVQSDKKAIVSAELGGLQKVPGEITVRTGRLTEGEVLAKVEDVIIAASRNYGKGRVIYSGIPLEKLNSESVRIWSLLFGQGDNSHAVDVKMQTAQEKRLIGNDQLGHAASYLPQLKTPPVPKVVVAWVIYVLVVGPGLYWLLKRYDRRDWMWWIVPACAVITTGAVYLVSPAQRINAPLSQTLSIVEIMDSDRAEINATAAFISPYGGTLNIEGAKDTFIWPSNYSYNNTQKRPIIQLDEKINPRISFPSVEYWSMRQARANVLKKNIGKIEGSLILENGYLKGRFKNNTQMDLRDCKVLLGGRNISLENLPAGGQVEINQSILKWPNSLGPNEYKDLLVPSIGPGETDIYVREREMADSVLGPMVNLRSNQPMFFGWSENSPEMFKLVSNHRDIKSSSLALVTQEIPLDIPMGQKIELPPGMYLPKMIETRGAYNQTPMGFTLYEGKLTLGINLLRPLNKADYKVVSINFGSQTNNNIAIKIYDWHDKLWKDVSSAGISLTAEELKKYSSPSGEFQFQFEKTAGIGQPERIDLPAITVEGVISQ